MRNSFYRTVACVVASLAFIAPVAATDLLPYGNASLPEQIFEPRDTSAGYPAPGYAGYPAPRYYDDGHYASVPGYCDFNDRALASYDHSLRKQCYQEGPPGMAMSPGARYGYYDADPRVTSQRYYGEQPFDGYASGRPISPPGRYDDYNYETNHSFLASPPDRYYGR